MYLSLSSQVLWLFECVFCSFVVLVEMEKTRLLPKNLPSRKIEAALLRPALLVRYDPLVVDSALYLYEAEILERNLIFRYCNVVKPEKLSVILDLLEYDAFLIERLVSQIDLFDLL